MQATGGEGRIVTITFKSNQAIQTSTKSNILFHGKQKLVQAAKQLETVSCNISVKLSPLQDTFMWFLSVSRASFWSLEGPFLIELCQTAYSNLCANFLSITKVSSKESERISLIPYLNQGC